MSEQLTTPAVPDEEDDVTGFHYPYGYFAQPLFYRGGYVVRPGDSLSAIALRVYGDARLWPAIYAANPHRIFPGQSLRLP